MEIVFYIFFMVIFVAGCLFISYILVRRIYGDKDPRKWKPQLFTKDVTFKSVFHTNQKKDKDSNKDK